MFTVAATLAEPNKTLRLIVPDSRQNGDARLLAPVECLVWLKAIYVSLTVSRDR
jgi:hypothetical protein